MDSFHARNHKSRRPRPAAAAPERAGLRADQLLVVRGLAGSRTGAQHLIQAGRVSWLGPHGSQPIAKPSELLPENATLQVAADVADRYVSRGGLKLAGALDHTGLVVAGQDCLDLGQSTGGFTDCLLQAGAARVLGIEVGHGQLHPRLAQDPRTLCLEGLNARVLNAQQLGEHFPPGGFTVIVGDLSFISLTLVLPAVAALLAPDGDLLLLVKPQFEVGPQGLGKGGIVRDAALYPQVQARVCATCEHVGLHVCDYFDSALTGGDGNREFFLHARRAGGATPRPLTDHAHPGE